jgi:hypothetical protein
MGQKNLSDIHAVFGECPRIDFHELGLPNGRQRLLDAHRNRLSVRLEKHPPGHDGARTNQHNLGP